jgi:hypothetical protein
VLVLLARGLGLRRNANGSATSRPFTVFDTQILSTGLGCCWPRSAVAVPAGTNSAPAAAAIRRNALVLIVTGRVWAIPLPLLLLPVSLVAGRAGHATGDLDKVFEFVLVATPFNVAAATLGVTLRAVARR